METIAIIISCWLLTYFLHSIAFFGLAKLLVQTEAFAHTRAKEILWKVALCGGILTASIQVFTGTGVFTSVMEPSSANVQTVAEKPNTLPVENLQMGGIKPMTKGQEIATLVANEQIEVATTPDNYDSGLHSTDFFMIASGLWFIISSLLIIRLFIQKHIFIKSISPREKVADEGLLYALFKLCSKAGIDQKIVLTVSENLYSPLAIGRGEICLPARSFTELSGEQQQSMLAHELAHIIRKDAIWLRVCNFLETVLFFQPFNRLMRIELHEVTEQRCDEWAIRSTGNAKPLADCLVKVAEWMTEPTSLRFASGMALHQSSLRQRIINILKNQYFTQNKLNRMKVITLLAAIMVFTTFILPGKTWLSVSFAHGSFFNRHEISIGQTPAMEVEMIGMEVEEIPEMPEMEIAEILAIQGVAVLPVLMQTAGGSDTLRFGDDFMLITKGNGDFEIYKDKQFIGKENYEKYKQDFILKSDNSIEILSKNGIKVTPSKQSREAPTNWSWGAFDNIEPAIAPFVVEPTTDKAFSKSWRSGSSFSFFSDADDYSYSSNENGQKVKIKFEKDYKVSSLNIDGKEIDKADFAKHQDLIDYAIKFCKRNKETATFDEKMMQESQISMQKLEKEMQEVQHKHEKTMQQHHQIMEKDAQIYEQQAHQMAAQAKKAQENSDKILNELIKDGLIKSKSDHYEMRLNKRGLFIDDEKQSETLFEKYKKLFKETTGNEIVNGNNFIMNN